MLTLDASSVSLNGDFAELWVPEKGEGNLASSPSMHTRKGKFETLKKRVLHGPDWNVLIVRT